MSKINSVVISSRTPQVILPPNNITRELRTATGRAMLESEFGDGVRDNSFSSTSAVISHDAHGVYSGTYREMLSSSHQVVEHHGSCTNHSTVQTLDEAATVEQNDPQSSSLSSHIPVCEESSSKETDPWDRASTRKAPSIVPSPHIPQLVLPPTFGSSHIRTPGLSSQAPYCGS